jgi:hypothetical protein
MKSGEFIIWVNKSVYWSLDLNVIPNECEEPVNRCALIDSELQKEIEAIYFDAQWLLPIFSARSQIGMKQIAQKLKEITDKHKIEITPSSQMPEDKRVKETKKVAKVINLKEKK